MRPIKKTKNSGDMRWIMNSGQSILEIEREKERKTKKEENKNLNYCSVGLETWIIAMILISNSTKFNKKSYKKFKNERLNLSRLTTNK